MRYLSLPLVLLLGCPSSEPAPYPFSDDDDSSVADDDDATVDPAVLARGRASYDAYCGHCHGADGEGYAADFANALANPHFLSVATDGLLRSSIAHGRPGTVMSAWSLDFGGPMTPGEIDDLVALLRSWQTLERVTPALPSGGDAAAGEEVWAAQCAWCHDPGPKGRLAPSVDNPWLLHEVDDGFLRHAVSVGRPPTTMEPWQGLLSEEQIDDVVAYIRSRQVPVDDTKVPPFDPDLTDPLVNGEGPRADFAGELRQGRFASVQAVAAALAAGQSFVIADARPGGDYVAGHVAGAVSVPFYRAADLLPELPGDAWVITYCGCPHTLSGELADALSAEGVSAAVLDEGWYHWAEQGHPTAQGPQRR